MGLILTDLSRRNTILLNPSGRSRHKGHHQQCLHHTSSSLLTRKPLRQHTSLSVQLCCKAAKLAAPWFESAGTQVCNTSCSVLSHVQYTPNKANSEALSQPHSPHKPHGTSIKQAVLMQHDIDRQHLEHVPCSTMQPGHQTQE